MLMTLVFNRQRCVMLVGVFTLRSSGRPVGPKITACKRQLCRVGWCWRSVSVNDVFVWCRQAQHIRDCATAERQCLHGRRQEQHAQLASTLSLVSPAYISYSVCLLTAISTSCRFLLVNAVWSGTVTSRVWDIAGPSHAMLCKLLAIQSPRTNERLAGHHKMRHGAIGADTVLKLGA